jgi:hypothetical protein
MGMGTVAGGGEQLRLPAGCLAVLLPCASAARRARAVREAPRAARLAILVYKERRVRRARRRERLGAGGLGRARGRACCPALVVDVVVVEREL